MMRMGPPQQGHGWRKVSGMISGSVSGVATWSGGFMQSWVRILVMFALRVALASNP